MKKWMETRQVLDRLREIASAGGRAALATVVRVHGSAYRREGAKILVAEDGTTTGNVSGGCLEEDVREVALQVIRSGRPQFRSYCSGPDDIAAWDLGVGCDGQVDLHVRPVSDRNSAFRAFLDRDAPFAVCGAVTEEEGPDASPGDLVVTPSSHLGALGSERATKAATREARHRLARGDAPSGLCEIEDGTIFIDLFTPPPRLIVIGAGDDARPLVRLGTDAGLRVLVVDRRRGLLTPERFPEAAELVEGGPEELAGLVPLDDRSYAVVMNHHYLSDMGYLRTLLGTEAAYVGMLGPRQRTERILDALALEGLDAASDRIHGPVGLDLGPDGPEQVAISVLGEILAVRSGRGASFLRERRGTIHVPAP